jgi:phospholipase/carboxylesterase
MRKTTLGRLRCAVFDPPSMAAPERIVILSHGFGAPGEDLISLADELLRMEPSLAGGTQFIFPAAPLSLASQGIAGGLAWWMIDLESRIEAFERGEFDVFRNEYPPGMAEASDALLTVVEEAQKQTGLEASRLILGGFSQGSMVSTDVALRMKDRPAGLAVFSGTLLCEDRWKEMADRRGPLPVLQTHGHYDQILPYIGAEWLKELFENAGFPVDFRPFPGMHQIPYSALEGLVVMIRNIV